MIYSIHKLSKLSGVSSRTLRYYESMELLESSRDPSSGYRVYDQAAVDRLRQILFFRELDLPLKEIKKILTAADFDHKSALENHLQALKNKQTRLAALINNVEKSLLEEKGEIKMTDQEKFEGFKQNLIAENEAKYGSEVRAAYGDELVDQANAKLLAASKEEFQTIEALNEQFNTTLRAAVAEGDPAGDLAQAACDLHRRWLGFYWTSYSKEAHLGLAAMYVADERFRAYYEAIAEGASDFLAQALEIYCA